MNTTTNPNPDKCAQVVRRVRSGPLYVVVRCNKAHGHTGAHQRVVLAA